MAEAQLSRPYKSMICPHFPNHDSFYFFNLVQIIRTVYWNKRMLEIDAAAKYEVEKKFVLPPCLHIPVASKDKISITKFIGEISIELSRKGSDKAFLVSVQSPDKINSRLPIWKLKNSKVLHNELQVWVHVDYSNYRNAYKVAFPDEEIEGMVLDHIMNRRIARLKGFQYVRIIPISRKTNSSSSHSEKWGVARAKSSNKRQRPNLKHIQYADFTDIMKMLNVQPGGGVMEEINNGLKLIREK